MVIAVYDIKDAAGWVTVCRHRNLWGKLYTRVYYLEEDIVVLAFCPAPDQRWRPWEDVRMSWILNEDLEGKAA